MASRSRRRGTTALDPLMAGFAAGAAAFIVFAMPDWRFNEAVQLSGLPMVLPAAQPPLGLTARIAAMVAAGIGSFALVFLVLRALGKPAPDARRRSAPVEIELAAPKIRRADAHPDAPSRRPILAGLDLGKPFDEVDVAEPAPRAEAETIAPEQQAPEEDSADELEEEVCFHHPADEPDELEPAALEAADDEEEPSFALCEEEPEQVEAEQEELEQVEAHEPQPLASFADRFNHGPVDEQASIASLMQRLEAGLRQRRRDPWPVPAPAKANGSNGSNGQSSEIDARLRSAIEDLQRLASRAN